MSFSGRTAVSKTANEGSIPSTPAIILSMKKFWAFFRTNWQSNLEYRSDQAIYVLSYTISPLVALSIWLAIAGTTTKLAFSRADLITYFFFLILVDIAVASWASYFIALRIEEGGLTEFLVKPLTIAEYFFINNLAQKVMRLAILIPLFAILGSFLLKGFTFTPLSAFLFISSVLIAYEINFFFSVILGLSNFWLHDIDFLRNHFDLAHRLLSGAVVPIVFLPGWLQQINMALPFRYMLSFPVEIVTNKLSPDQLVLGFCVQIFWGALLYLSYRFMYLQGIKAYQGYGS